MRITASCCCGAEATFDSNGSNGHFEEARVMAAFERWNEKHAGKCEPEQPLLDAAVAVATDTALESVAGWYPSLVALKKVLAEATESGERGIQELRP